MNGQWLGPYTGTGSGTLVLELDDMGTHYQGRAFAYDDRTAMPSSYVFITTPGKANSFRLRSVPVWPIDPHSGNVTSWPAIAGAFPGVAFPSTADINWDWNGQRVQVDWTTDIGTSGFADLPKSQAGAPSAYQPEKGMQDWGSFKLYASSLEHRRYIFRGQRQLARLRTSFHRAGRADLMRFMEEDIKALYRHLSSRTAHVFDLTDPDENGAFYNLVQHHGYPTPLLDWTYSPFVGAFFAYHRVSKIDVERASEEDKVRIFIFDQREWRKLLPQIPKVAPARPHVSLMEFISINNERMIPQQAVSSLTNVDDIESHIAKMEGPGRKFLQIIDLPLKQRTLVMRELSAMGITAGSLFPGLDGMCEELKERFF
jgi:FRG domain